MDSASFLPNQSLTLAYSLPLLAFSVPLTFGGAFLTLDRTRSFPPRDFNDGWFGRTSETFVDKMKRNMRLQGGLGGLCAGFLFGLEIFTLLALLLPEEVMTLKHLSSSALVVPALFSGALCAILAALLQPVALIFSGLAGGLTAALGLSIITHPPLIARYIFLALFEMGFATTLVIAKSRHVALRVALACLGSFGMVQSISLLSVFDGWSIPFDRLYVNDGINWGTEKEHSMTALFSLLVAIGCGTDWLLKRRFGEDPGQRWDSLLANFNSSLPTRTGVFEPLPPWYSALVAPFQHPTPKQQPLLPGAYPVNLDSKPPLTFMPTRAMTKLQKPSEGPRSAKALSTGFNASKKKRDPLVFAPSSLDSDSDTDIDDDHVSRNGNLRSLMDVTLVGDDMKSSKPVDNVTEVDIGDLADAPPLPVLRSGAPLAAARGEWGAFWSAVHRKAAKS